MSGAGKSSLVDRLVAAYREKNRRVGVIAVDPSSAYSGGAILGDRVRMQSHSADQDVFIRSMATRGYLGGLARASNDAIDLLDAAGYGEWLAESPEEITEIALGLGADLGALADLRGRLRDEVAGSALADVEGFTRCLEDAYREMWRTWCKDSR